MTGGMALIAIASAVIGMATAGGGMVLLAIGLFGWAPVWPCLMPWHLGWRCGFFAPPQGSGVVNAGTFLGGSGGVAGGAIAFTLGASSVC